MRAHRCPFARKAPKPTLLALSNEGVAAGYTGGEGMFDRQLVDLGGTWKSLSCPPSRQPNNVT